MDERACRHCGCTDRFGCPEGCHWVPLPNGHLLCSVCWGTTPKRWRAYTRCKPDTDPMLLPPLQIFNRVGRLVGYAWHISEAQAMARGIDAYYHTLRRQADQAQGRKHWITVAHRARQPIIIGKTWSNRHVSTRH